jgi:hypothetical protein
VSTLRNGVLDGSRRYRPHCDLGTKQMDHVAREAPGSGLEGAWQRPLRMTASSRKAMAAKRRDARATKVEEKDDKDMIDVYDEPRPQGLRRKDKKRWCRGKIGVEHVPVCMKVQALAAYGCFDNWRILACKVCGKVLAHYSPAWTKPKPVWVTV